MKQTDQTRIACEQAFLQLLANTPYSKVRMGDIARQAGIARPTLYRYFHSKEELFRSIIDGLFEQFYDIAEPLLENLNEAQSLQLNMLAASVAQQHRDVIQSLMDSNADDVFASQLRKYFSRMIGGMLRQQNRQIQSLQDLELVTSMLAGACLYTIKEWLAKDYDRPPEDVARILNHTFSWRLVDLVSTKSA